MSSPISLPPQSEISLSFISLALHSNPSAPCMLEPLTGYVRTGGLTLLIGGGNSGKTLLLSTVSGRVPNLEVSGVMFNKKTRFTSKNSAEVGFIGQEDHLLGELTPAESVRFAAALGHSGGDKTREEKIVSEVLDGLEMSRVKDNAIGTVLRRGLSGGEKRRVSVGTVLAGHHQVVAIDEPTSGLDAAVAFSAIASIKLLAQQQKTGVILSLHQPSARILGLVDDLIVLHQGHCIYCGPTVNAVDYFSSIGFPTPVNNTPTDYFLHIAASHGTELAVAYQQSPLRAMINEHLSSFVVPTEIVRSTFPQPLWKQILLLLNRNLMQTAVRDITLYFFQQMMTAGFAFIVGAVFFSLSRVIGPRIQEQSNGVVWLVFIGAFLQIFKVYHLYTANERFQEEKGNNMYSSSAYAISSFLTSALMSFIVYIPTLLIGYGMIGYPLGAIGYTIFSLWLLTLTAESMLDVVCHVIPSLPTSILISQGLMVILCVYTGSSFISDSSLGFWVWLSELSVFNWSSRGILIVIFRHMIYTCPSSSYDSTTHTCPFQGYSFPCDASSPSGVCNVQGTSVLKLYQGITETDEWFQAGMLIVLLVGFRLISFIFCIKPFPEMVHAVTRRIPPLWTVAPALPNVSAPGIKADEYTQVNISQQPTLALSASARRLTGVHLVFKDVSMNLGNAKGKLLIDRVSGSAQPGRVLAILGPSGAGKTTFLNAISGRAPYAVISGQVSLGERTLDVKHLAYVPQFDALNPSLTVLQTFTNTAALMQIDGVQGNASVTELLSVMELTDLKDEYVRSLNSGIRKRMSIALGLLTKPLVLLLDEPTTGLDAETAARIVQYIIRATRGTGVITLLTVHQPSFQLFESLDDLLLLSNGEPAFFGPVNKSGEYFENLGYRPAPASNPADLYLDLMNATPSELAALKDPNTDPPPKSSLENDTNKENVVTDQVEPDKSGVGQSATANTMKAASLKWREDFEKSLFNQNQIAAYNTQATRALSKADIDALATPRPSEWSRLVTLTKIRIIYLWQEPVVYGYRLIELIFLAIFTGTLFLRLPTSIFSIREIGGALFFSLWTILFIAISGTPIAVRDRITFENELLNRSYSVSTYLVSVLLASVPYQLISAIIYEVILWYLVGFNDNFGAYVFATAITFALFLMMESIALISSQVLKNAMLATTFSMVVLGILFLFPGFFAPVNEMPVSIFWASYIVPTHYAFTSMLANIFQGQNYAEGNGASMSGSDVMYEYFIVHSSYNKWLDFFIVIVYTMGFRVLHWLIIKFEYRNYGHEKSR